MKFSSKLFIGNVVLILITLVMGYKAMQVEKAFNKRLKNVQEETLPVIDALQAMETNVAKLGHAVSEYGLVHANMIINNKHEKMMHDGMKIDDSEVDAALQEFNNIFMPYEELVTTFFPHEKEIVGQLKSEWDKLRKQSAKVVSFCEKSPLRQELIEEKRKLEELEGQFLAATAMALRHEKQEFAERQGQLGEATANFKKSIITLIGVFCLLSVFFSFFFGSYIIGSLNKIKIASKRFSEGDLSARVKHSSQDEIGDVAIVINNMAASLSEKTKAIEDSRMNLQSAYDEISKLILQVVDQEDFSIRYTSPNLEACWKKKECQNVDCPCYGKGPMRCWRVAGTFCDGEEQVSVDSKDKDCPQCEILQEASGDPVFMIGEEFNHMMQILEGKNSELNDAFEKLKATQSQMLQQEKMASVGQLAAGVAHEINNPMGFITSNMSSLEKYVGKFVEFIDAQTKVLQKVDAGESLTELRKKLKLDFVIEDIKDLLEESRDGAMRVTEIVQNLKTFSRVDATSKIVQSNINQCLESTLKITWNELKYKCTVHKEFSDLPETFCNPQKLNQVFVNLLVNASHAIEEKGDVTVKSWQEDDSIKVSITDTGNGIAPENIDRLFEPFFTTKEVGKGTGLGLSICYDIVQEHGGTVEVVSEVGKGTTFTVVLPIKEQAEILA